MKKIKFSVLDLVLKRKDDDNADTFLRLEKAAKQAEKFGYTRFWIAEQHNSELFLSTSTTILINHIANCTKKIRVGSGGIMLQNHFPLFIAEQFGTLNSLHSGRIDLGVGRGAGGDSAFVSLIQSEKGIKRIPLDDRIKELNCLLRNEYSDIKAYPSKDENIPIWILGVSTDSAKIAGQLNLPYVCGGHLNFKKISEVSKAYIDNFEKNDKNIKPYLIVSLNIIIANTDEEADILSSSFLNMIAGGKAGRKVPFTHPTQKKIYNGNVEIEKKMSDMPEHIIIGGKWTVKKALTEIIKISNPDEIMITNYIYGNKLRRRGFKYLSEIIKQINSSL